MAQYTTQCVWQGGVVKTRNGGLYVTSHGYCRLVQSVFPMFTSLIQPNRYIKMQKWHISNKHCRLRPMSTNINTSIFLDFLQKCVTPSCHPTQQNLPRVSPGLFLIFFLSFLPRTNFTILSLKAIKWSLRMLFFLLLHKKGKTSHSCVPLMAVSFLRVGKCLANSNVSYAAGCRLSLHWGVGGGGVREFLWRR